MNLKLQSLTVPLKLDVNILLMSYYKIKEMKRKSEIKPTKIWLTLSSGDGISISEKNVQKKRKKTKHERCKKTRTLFYDNSQKRPIYSREILLR